MCVVCFAAGSDNMTNYVTSETIRRLRERRHLTQRELAERLNVSDKTCLLYTSA